MAFAVGGLSSVSSIPSTRCPPRVLANATISLNSLSRPYAAKSLPSCQGSRLPSRPGISCHAAAPRASPQIQLLEKIIALVVDDDERREILDFDSPDRFHAEFGMF